jgi:hypothetical protein
VLWCKRFFFGSAAVAVAAAADDDDRRRPPTTTAAATARRSSNQLVKTRRPVLHERGRIGQKMALGQDFAARVLFLLTTPLYAGTCSLATTKPTSHQFIYPLPFAARVSLPHQTPLFFPAVPARASQTFVAPFGP